MLTTKQRRVLDFIKGVIESSGRPPTIREIGRKFSFSSTGTVRDYLDALLKKGYIRLQRGSSRGIKLIKEDRIPILGRIAAGGPVISEEFLDGYIDARLPCQDDIFALRVRGDSMTGAGLFDKDLVLVHRQNTAQSGDIVACLVDLEATIKRLIKKAGKFYLKPENPGYKPIKVTQTTKIIGKVIMLIRRYSVP